MTERTFAPVELTNEQADELLRILGESRRGRPLTPRDLPVMSPEEFRARLRALNPPMSWDDYPDCDEETP